MSIFFLGLYLSSFYPSVAARGGFRSRGRGGGYGNRGSTSGSNAIPVGGKRPWQSR
jgi:hypothetical protein